MSPTARTEASALTVAVGIDDAGWEALVPAAERRCREAATAAFEAAPPAARINGEVSVMLADDALIRELNGRYRGIDKPTNVLAFAALEAGGPAPVGPAMLGDIVVARETVVREAAEACRSAADHLSHMVVHGMLHLLGFDHQTPAEADEMEAIEIGALATLGIADPYDSEPEAAVPAERTS